MVERHGYLVVSFEGDEPTPGKKVRLRGSRKEGLGLREISENGLEMFSSPEKIEESLAETPENPIFTTRIIRTEILIPESREEWNNISRIGSCVVMVGAMEDCFNLYGPSVVDGKRVPSAHDSWAPFYANGLTPFTDIEKVICHGGVVDELVRQTTTRAIPIGIWLEWP